MATKTRVPRVLAQEWAFDDLSRSHVCGAWTVAVNSEGRFLVFRDGAAYTRNRKGVATAPSFASPKAAQLYAEARMAAKRGGRPKSAVDGKFASLRLSLGEIAQIKAAFPDVTQSAALRMLLAPALEALPAVAPSASETAQAAS